MFSSLLARCPHTHMRTLCIVHTEQYYYSNLIHVLYLYHIEYLGELKSALTDISRTPINSFTIYTVTEFTIAV